jgi:prepilin-type N-terminal cleavage/methylation domain-containing protein
MIESTIGNHSGSRDGSGREGGNMKTNQGFTLIEAAVVMAVVGIMATVTVKSSKKVLAQSELQAATMNLLAQLKSTRSVALKYDANVMVKFIADRCSIFVDTVSNGSREVKELVKVYKLPSQISIGRAASGPTAAPTASMAYDADGIAGVWKASVMTVSNNAVGTIDTGVIYLKSSKLPKITYCIGNTSARRSLQIYKYGGATWKKL